MIVSIVLRIINSKVFASEAVEVTPTWYDGDYSYLADNSYFVLADSQIALQNQFIYQLAYNFDNGNNTLKENVRSVCSDIYNAITSRTSVNNTKYVYIIRNLDNTYNSAGFSYQILNLPGMNNIVYADLTLSNGYKLLNVPWYSFTRAASRPCVYVNSNNSSVVATLTSGNTSIPIAQIGQYSSNWFMLFEKVGLLLSNADYESFLSEIETTLEESYTQQYYTKQAVQNTYNYLSNDNVETISSLGISQPQISESIDLTDVFDSMENLLTNETYVSKFFTFSIPGHNYVFSISPTLLEDNLVRVGGQNIVSIIHALWYIGLYGWYIFAYFGIFGKLISGDWFHLVKSSSPVTNIVRMSVSSLKG